MPLSGKMFLINKNKNANKSSPSWNANVHPIKKTRSVKILPWKKTPPAPVSPFTDMNTCGSVSTDTEQEEFSQRSVTYRMNSDTSRTQPSPRTPVQSLRRHNKVSPKPAPIRTDGLVQKPLSAGSEALHGVSGHNNPPASPQSSRAGSSQGMRRRRVSAPTKPGSPAASASSTRRRHGSGHSHGHSHGHNPWEVKKEGGHHHSHLITYQVSGLDNVSGVVTDLSVPDETGGRGVAAGGTAGSSTSALTPVISAPRACTEESLGAGWSLGVHKFNPLENAPAEDKSVFSPSEGNIAQVPSASHTRDSLLKKEFHSIKHSLAKSYQKYRDKKKTDDDSTHAIAYQYMDNWLKKNKKMTSNDSHISKNELTVRAEGMKRQKVISCHHG